MVGRVISTKMKSTATVLVERVAMHPLYKKTYVQSKKYLAHDLIGVKDGDLVDIINCKPISRKKNWQIVKVVGKNLAEITEEKLKKEAEKVILEVMPEDRSENSENLDSQNIGISDNQTNRNSDVSGAPSNSEISGKKKSRKKKEAK
ncbi:30S ribosomal protein S17 [Candidatus Daviesbacteria bacterium]|nr:30S ribosomal protein S17 [Candidatus Daviesbacteria bacterium]